MKKYKIKKVFNIKDAPVEVQKKFSELDIISDEDSYISWYVFDYEWKEKEELKDKDDIIYKYGEDDDTKYNIRGDDPISDWLYENGADPGEEILIGCE